MKRLAFAFILTAVFAQSAFAITQTERDRSKFDFISATGPVGASASPSPAEITRGSASPATGYNKAVEEHKAHNDTTTAPKKAKGSKKAHKKHTKKTATKDATKEAPRQ